MGAMSERGAWLRPRLAFRRPAAPTHDAAAAFGEAMLPHLDAAYGLARFLARDPTAAEDIVQDAYLRAWRAFPGYRGGAAKAWLLTIVRNCFLSGAGARRGGEAPVIDEGALSARQAEALARVADPDQDSPEAALLRAGEAARVRAAIEALQEPFRETLVLRELDELSYREISAITGAPIGTVMSRLARARQMLAASLLPGMADDAPVLIGKPMP